MPSKGDSQADVVSSARSDGLAELLIEAKEIMQNRLPCMSLYVCDDGQAVELILDTSLDYYSEHISGEGADIALYREMDTDRVVGCRLPLLNHRLAVGHIGPFRLNDGFKIDDAGR